MLETLNDILAPAIAIQDAIADLDACFLHGFVGGQYEILAALPQIFAGTPLQSIYAVIRYCFAGKLDGARERRQSGKKRVGQPL